MRVIKLFIFVFPIIIVLSIFILVWILLCTEQARAFYTGFGVIVTLTAGLITYNTWIGQRILELDKEYDDLAERRKIFWDTIDKAYKVYNRKISLNLNNKLVDDLIRRRMNIYPPEFDPQKIKDSPRSDLLTAAKKVRNKAESLNKESNLRKLWDFAVFLYPPKEKPLSGYCWLINSKTSTQFNKARGDLSRFWNRWASKWYSRQYILSNYKSAHEQLIMLTWLELALVIQTDDFGKGKVALFTLTKKIDRKVNSIKWFSLND